MTTKNKKQSKTIDQPKDDSVQTEKKTSLTFDGKEYFFEDLTQEQQVIINHINSLESKARDAQFNLDQCNVAKQAFINMLKESLDE